MNREDILALEKQMWEAAKDRNVSGFLDLVSDQAIMVCGGYRCTGKEYSEIIAFFDCKTYNISKHHHFEIASVVYSYRAMKDVLNIL